MVAMRRWRRGGLIRVGALLAGLFVAFACAEFVLDPQALERGVRGIQLNQVNLVLDDGAAEHLVATVLDQTGIPFEQLPSGRTIQWISSATDIATVDSDGMVAANRPGTAHITASVIGGEGNISATADVTVLQVPTALAIASGDAQAGTVGAALPQPLRARVTDRWGDGVPDITVDFSVTGGSGSLNSANAVTGADGEAEVTWTLGTQTGANGAEARAARLPQAVASFTAQGQPGPVSALDKVSGDAQSGVVGAGLADPLVAKVSDRYGNAVPGATVNWTVVSGGGTVSPASPVTDALGTASATFTLGPAGGTQSARADVGGVLVAAYTATAIVSVATVTVSPATASLTVGATQAFTANPTDAGGNALTGHAVTWSTNDEAVATIDADGLLVARNAGSVTVTATVEGVAGTAAVTVTALIVPVASVTVSPAGTSIAVGATLQYAATPQDAAGNPLSGRAVTWSVVDDAVASIVPGGLLTALAAGMTTVKATVEGVDGTTGVTVTAVVVPVVSVEVSPPAVTLASGATPQFTATPRDAGGNALGGRVVTWSSDNTAVVSVDAAGLGQALLVGTATITATVEGVGGTASVTVTPGAASPSLSVATASAANVASGSLVTVTLLARDAAGNNVPSLSVVFTASGGTSTGTLSPVTDHADGTYSVTFTGGVAGTATTIGVTIGGIAVTTPLPTVTVTPGPASTTTSLIAVAEATVPEGGNVTLTLQARDAAGNSVTGLTVAFTASGGTSTGIIGVVTDHDDGTYTATFTAQTAGTPLTIGAAMNGDLVTSALPTLQVVTVSGSQVIRWIGLTGGLWSDPTRWDLGRIPAALDTVYIEDNANGEAFVTIDQAVNVAKIVIGPQSALAVQANGQAITVSDSLVIRSGPGGTDGKLFLNGSASVNGPAMLNQGVLWLTSAQINAALRNEGQVFARVDDAAAGEGSDDNVSNVNASFANVGTLTVELGQTGSSSIEVTGEFVNSGLVDLTGSTPGADARSAILWVRGGALRNLAAGTIQASGGVGGRVLRGALDNDGTITVALTAGQVLFVQAETAADVLRNDGTITMSGGNLTLALNPGQRFTNAGTLTVGVGTTLSVVAGRLDNTGTLAGGGTIDVSAAALGGTLVFGGTVSPGSAPGSAGTLTVIGDFEATDSGSDELEIELGGVAAGSQYDRLVISGRADFSGAIMNVTLINGFTPVPGQSFTVLTHASRGAGFDDINLPALPAGQWQTVHSETALVLRVIDPAATVAAIAVNAGDGQSAPVGSLVPVLPSVLLTGASAQPVPGVLVQFEVVSGDGSVIAASTVSDVNGIATVGGWMLGPVPGPNSLTATVAAAGVAGNPVTFTATGTFVSAIPAAIAINDGDGQTTVEGNQVPIPPSVLVTDALSQPLAGVQVEFAVATGGGTVTDAIQISDVNGIARVGSWTIGAGSNTLTATAPGTGVTGNPVTFTATGTLIRTWTGAVSTDWSDPANWSPAGVPASEDIVIIAPAANQPTLTGTSVSGGLQIGGSGARLTLGGHTLTTGFLSVHTDGLLVMTNPADVMIVTGSAFFQGGNETGLLSAGELRIGGTFNQTVQTDTHSFTASGTHRVVFNGTSLQSVGFCCSSSAGASGFQDLDISTSAGINIQNSLSGVFVYGTFISQPGAGPAPLLFGFTRPLRAARFQVDRLVVDRGVLILDEGGMAASQQFDNVTFQESVNTYSTRTQLTIVGPGSAGPARSLTFNNVRFVPLVAGNTGRYVNVTATSGSLILNLPGANALVGGNGPAFTTTAGAVTVNW